MGNVNDYRKGQRVTTVATRHRRLAADFPGWGAEDYADHLLETPAGLTGTVTTVSSHGSNPWTRYTVLFDDGSRGIDFVPGADFTWEA